MIRGSCLCGEVKYELVKPPAVMNICHCSMCRKVTGSSYGVFVHTDLDNFCWTAGEHSITRYESSPGEFRAFCPVCGSNVPVSENDGSVIIPAGSFDDDPRSRPAVQIFTGSRAPWHDVDAATPAFDEFEPDDFFDQ